MASHAELARHYDRWAAEMENLPEFYDWALSVLATMPLAKDAAIVDVGCGTGALLSRLDGAGFRRLHGVDFSRGCLALAFARAPKASLSIHDIVAAPLDGRYDVAVLTTVICFVADPAAALANVQRSLVDDGWFLITIRNRLAYFPWSLAAGLHGFLRWSPRLHHWFRWWTVPLALRRHDQPHERVYSTREMRRLLTTVGFRIVAERGTGVLPMLRVPGVPALRRPLERLDRVTDRLPFGPLCSWYVFVCRNVGGSASVRRGVA